MTSAATRLHVERTGDPAVLRWVVHSSEVMAGGDGACRPDPSSSLGALVGGGRVGSVWIEDATVLVRCGDGCWDTLAGAVQQAIAEDLGAGAAWLTERASAAAVGLARRSVPVVVGCGSPARCPGCAAASGQ